MTTTAVRKPSTTTEAPLVLTTDAPRTLGFFNQFTLWGNLGISLFGPVTGALRRAGLAELSPDFMRLLRYGRAVDTSRLVEEIGYEPRFDAVEAVEDFARTQRGRSLVPSPRQVVPR